MLGVSGGPTPRLSRRALRICGSVLSLNGALSIEVKSKSYFDSHWAQGQRVDRYHMHLLGR